LGYIEVFHIHENVNYSIDGYHPIIYRTRPDTVRGRGGVALYINELLQYIVRQDLSVFISHAYESLFVEIGNAPIGNKPIIIANTPPFADIDNFTRHLYTALNKINEEHKSVFILGDINIDFQKFESHAKTNSLIESIYSFGIPPLITKPTRITDFSQQLLIMCILIY
ncbi:hypothetical protein LSH36_16g14063, partial [Paralvinella palmiformis]